MSAANYNIHDHPQLELDASRHPISLTESKNSEADDKKEVNDEEGKQMSISNVVEPSSVEVAGPPNGGARAWFQVAAAFVLFFNTW